MKITPIASGANIGNVGSNIAAPDTGGRVATPDKLQRALAIAKGEEYTIQPSDTYTDPQVERMNKPKRITMKTNATVYRDGVPPGEEVPTASESKSQAVQSVASEGQSEPNSSISDDSVQTSPVVEDTKPLSPQFAALARQKRALQVKERELAEREKAIASQPPKSDGGEVLARLKSQPLSVLQEAGVTYDDLTTAIIENQNGVTPEIQALRAELKALKEGVDKTFQERDTQQEAQVFAEMKREAERLIAVGDTYEMIRATGKLPEAMELIRRTWKEKNEVLEVSEALQLVEEDLINESLKLANLTKVQSRMKSPTPAPTVQQPKQMKTLTDRDGAAPSMSRRQRAMAAALGTLRK